MPYPLAQVTEVSAMQDVARPLRGEATWQHLMHWDPFRIHGGGYKIALCCPSTDTVVAFKFKEPLGRDLAEKLDQVASTQLDTDMANLNDLEQPPHSQLMPQNTFEDFFEGDVPYGPALAGDSPHRVQPVDFESETEMDNFTSTQDPYFLEEGATDTSGLPQVLTESSTPLTEEVASPARAAATPVPALVPDCGDIVEVEEEELEEELASPEPAAPAAAAGDTVTVEEEELAAPPPSGTADIEDQLAALERPDQAPTGVKPAAAKSGKLSAKPRAKPKAAKSSKPAAAEGSNPLTAKGARITPDMSPGTVAKIKEARAQRKRDQSTQWHDRFQKKGAA